MPSVSEERAPLLAVAPAEQRSPFPNKDRKSCLGERFANFGKNFAKQNSSGAGKPNSPISTKQNYPRERPATQVAKNLVPYGIE